MPITSYTYQDSQVLERIAPELIQSSVLVDPIFKAYPIRDLKAAKLRWTVDDNSRGLMNPRGYDGAPTRVVRPGRSLFEALPGVYGEFGLLDELELTTRAASFPANVDLPMDVSDMVTEWQSILTTRQSQRMRMTAWVLATTHNLVVPLPQGGVGHQESFAGQTMTVPVLWSNLMTATPLHDLRQLQFAYGRGTSNSFMAQAEAWMNQKTAQYLMDNRNPADVGGIRAEYGATVFNSIADFNKILLSQGAPTIMIYEDSYQVDVPGAAPGTNPGNAYQMYLPDGVVLVIAARPNGEVPGEFLWTFNMVNKSTQPYALVKDKTGGNKGFETVPPIIEVHQGFNGGPVQKRPSQTVTMIVA